MAQAADNPRGPRFASEITPKRIEYLWENRIPRGMMTVVAGKPDQGKGLFSTHVAAEVSNRGAKVLFSAAEDDEEQMTTPRLIAAGADLDNVIVWSFLLPAHFDEVAALVVDHKVELLVMDPFNAHLAGVSRHADSIRKVLGPIDQLARETGVSVLIVEHAVKRIPKSADPISAIGGNSSGLTAAARAGFIFGVDPDDDDQRVLCSVKGNNSGRKDAIIFETDLREQPVVGEIPSLLLHDERPYDAMRLLTVTETGKMGRKPDKRAAAAEWLTTYLATQGQPVPAGDVFEDAKQYGLTERTVRNAAKDMRVEKNPPGGGPKCTWDLPDDIKQDLGLDVDEDEEGEQS